MKGLRMLALAAAVSATSTSYALVVTPTTDGALMANTLVGSGTSIIPGTVAYTGAPTQSGTFTDGLAAGLGIDTGIILTTGDATGAPGPNTSPGYTKIWGTPGDANLDTLIGATTYDAASLSFGFTTDSGELYFDFAFASEEYNEFVGTSFNDAFAIFVDDVNVALAPDGNPVSVNNVNCGNPMGATGSNCAFFNNNQGGTFNLQYDGFTDLFTASVTGLSAGTHTIKFAIADTADRKLDSAVFIAANSFTSTNPHPVPEPAGIALLGAGLAGMAVRRRKKAN